MSIIRPFRGVRYDLEKVLLKQVITPPYDVISPEMREKFANRSPYNAVHIDLPAGGEDRYRNAGDIYRQWKNSRVLIKEEQPAFYLYEQIYEYAGRQYVRSGFVGALKLSEFGKGQVFPHEKTLSGPKQDRYELMKAAKADFSQIFGVYQDEENRLAPVFSEIKKSMPIASAVDDDMVKHSIWSITEEDVVNKIESFMRDKAVYIADGHHRYETALKYRDDIRKDEGVSDEETRPYDYVMMMVVNFMDEGLRVFPTHRVIDVKEDFSDEDFLNALKEKVDVSLLENKEAALKFMEENADVSGAWVFMGRRGLYGMKIIKEAMEGLHPVYRKVDTFLLENVALKGYFDYDENKLLSKEGLHFFQSWEEMEKYIEQNPAVGFFLHPEDMETIREVSESGLTMPQKSTYFYPKLATGLLFNDL